MYVCKVDTIIGYVVKDRWSQVADGHLGPPEMAISHLGLGSNVQSSNLMINLLMIGYLSLGLNGQRPFGAGLNGHRPPETVGHLCPMQRYNANESEKKQSVRSSLISHQGITSILCLQAKDTRLCNMGGKYWFLTVRGSNYRCKVAICV